MLDVVQQLHGMLGNDDVMAIRSKAATRTTRAVSEVAEREPAHVNPSEHQPPHVAAL